MAKMSRKAFVLLLLEEIIKERNVYLFQNECYNAEIMLCLSMMQCYKSRYLNKERRGPYSFTMLNPTIAAIIAGDNKLTKRHIRVSTKTFLLLLRYFPKKHKGWSQEIEVTVFLYWLACGTSYRVVAMSFCMPKSTVFDIVKKYLDNILSLAPKVILFPALEELNDIGQHFARRARSDAFKNAVGAIDGCHVRVFCPTTLKNQYINRKLFYSLQLQGICDADYYFVDIFCGYPGSVHDMRVLKNSTIYQTRNFPPDGYYLLGDSGYANRLQPVPIITPFKGSDLSHQQSKFNRHHSMGRCIIERVFGMMKTRWRTIFSKALEVKLRKAVKVIGACAVMHNICVSAGDFVQPAALVKEKTRHPPRQFRDEVDAELLRQEIMNSII